MKVNLYDFDNTIYKGDSSFDFFFFSFKKKPSIIKFVPSIFVGFLNYKLKKINKTELKEINFRFLKSIDTDKMVNDFWKTHEKNIKEFYLNKNHDKDIIISASPEFLLKPMTDKLKVLELIGSRVDKNTGKFRGLNCHGAEKVKRLKEKYKDIEVMEAYSDSLSDIPILKLASFSYLVKGNKIKLKDF